MGLESLIQLWQANEIFRAVSYLIATLIVAEVIHLTLKFYAKFASSTKSDLDDFLLHVITKPAYYLLIFAGIWLAIHSLSLPETWTRWINGIFYVGGILVGAIILSKLAAFFIQRWLQVHKKFSKTPQLITKIISVSVFVIGLVMILAHFEVEITPLIATLGVGGLAVGLALQGTLSNLFAGLHIISAQPIRVGDFITVGTEVEGYVEDISWRDTTVRQLGNNMVIVPNSKLAESIITNYAKPIQEMSLVIPCGVGYGSDLEKVEKVTVEVGKKIQKSVEGAIKEHVPFVRFKHFGDSNIDFSIILRVQSYGNKFLVRHEFIKALMKAYNKNNIEISWPVRKIYQTKKKIN